MLSKVGPKETATVACVSQRFRVWASDDSLWSKFCAEELDLYSPENPLGIPSPSFRAAYQAWCEAFGMYPWPLVRRVKRCWGRIKGWLTVNFQVAVTILRKGATEDDIKNLEKSLKLKKLVAAVMGRCRSKKDSSIYFLLFLFFFSVFLSLWCL